MRKIFIDCGAWTGNSVKKFKSLHNDWKEWEIFCFEPHKKSFKELVKTQNDGFINFYNRAVWDKFTYRTLRCSSDERYTNSNSLTKSKKVKAYDSRFNESVICINLSDFIAKNFNKSDYIICKMNIEGSEYRVISKFILDSTTEYINEFFIDWHWQKMGMSFEQHNKIASKIKSKPWDNQL